MQQDWQDIKALEQRLHQFQHRQDKHFMRTVLHADFYEIGCSGRTFTLETILLDIAHELPTENKVVSQGFQFINLAENLIQVCYQQAILNNGSYDGYALRTSIWQKTLDCWQIRYHQGTPTPAFDILPKEN